jgi:hypothetical protein
MQLFDARLELQRGEERKNLTSRRRKKERGRGNQFYLFCSFFNNSFRRGDRLKKGKVVPVLN